MSAGPSLHDVLTVSGQLPQESWTRALRVQEETGERLDSVLTRLGLISEGALAAVVAQAAGCPISRAEEFPESPILGDRLPPRFLRDQRAVPLREEGEAVVVALADPLDGFARDALGFALERPIRPVVGLASDIEAALDRLYGPASADEAGDETVDSEDLERLKDLASDAPAIRAVNRLITRAVEMRASDIHAEPAEDRLIIRFRIDGVLREMEALPAAMRSPLVSRVKVMAGLNIAEKRLPQDGRLRLAVRGQDVDLRVATSPTLHGETLVMRLLDQSNLTLDFDTLGFDARLTEAFMHAIHQPNGIVLVTGPTGSGKTTTLYTALSEINTPERKVLTVEDPIEYRLPGVVQTQVMPGIGLSFAAALRSFLRQDPDVIMVGEIRDLETAQVAVQAALTGHMILSTLHTNSAASAVTRLADMGVEPFLITSTLRGVLAQRLVRRLCADCRRPYDPLPGALAELGLADAGDAPLYHAAGCPSCGDSGYRGRIALLEFLDVDDTVARLVLAHADVRDIEGAAREAGMRSMVEDGIAKARAGLTTVEEIIRVTRE